MNQWRAWTAPEDDILRANYPDHGRANTLAALTAAGYQRSGHAINNRAEYLGVRARPVPTQRPEPPPPPPAPTGDAAQIALLRLLLAAERGHLTWQQAADAAGLTLDTMTRRAVQEAARGAVTLT